MNKPTQADLILWILTHLESVTADQLRYLGIGNPSAVISRLIKQGYLIDRVVVSERLADESCYCRTEITYTLREEMFKR